MARSVASSIFGARGVRRIMRASASSAPVCLKQRVENSGFAYAPASAGRARARSSTASASARLRPWIMEKSA